VRQGGTPGPLLQLQRLCKKCVYTDCVNQWSRYVEAGTNATARLAKGELRMKPDEAEPPQNDAGRTLPTRVVTRKGRALARLALLIIRQGIACAYAKYKSDFDDLSVVSDETIRIEYNEDGSKKSETVVKKHARSIKVGSIVLAGGTVLYYFLSR
jgi:hypothetical protein